MTTHQKTRGWDVETDVIVVGFGAAGASAALQAGEDGASVLLLDRCHGGGATAASGGIIYAGGGTRYQLSAGFQDTPDEMYKYLKHEVGDAVSDETLRRFCDESPHMIEWLEKAGVPFEASLCPFKTSYPTDDYYLYFSGNESTRPYKDLAQPAPRGHRARGKGISGLALFNAFEQAVKKTDISVRCQTRVDELIQDADGRIVGVEGRTLRKGSISAPFLSFLTKINSKANTYAPPAGKLINSFCCMVFRLRSKPFRAKARKGVVLSAGGFIFNKDLVNQHHQIFTKCLPLGTYGDNGSGIKLGESVGGTTARMNNMTAWRFYVPPDTLMQGLMIGEQGERLCNEELYGAKQGDYIVAAGGKAFLVFDHDTYREAVSLIGKQCAAFQKLTMIPMLRLTRKKASTLEKLARKMKVPSQALKDTINNYNTMAANGEADPFGKTEKRFIPQVTPPFYAVDCSLQSKSGIPTAAMTLGGLVVDEETGLVRRKDGSSIEGLYAAGRSAVGVCSNGYFASGLSISDAIFSGRRAGRHAAARQEQSITPGISQPA